MKNYLFATLCVTSLLFSACKKEEPKPNPVPLGEQIEIVELKTRFGDMYVWLYPETPLHRENFLKLAGEGFYNGLLFHRIIPGFVIQGGDPKGDGTGGPGYTIPAEIFSSIKHKKGSLAAARLPDNVNPSKASSGSQFYISASTDGTKSLDGNYTVFGEVLKGIEFVDSIVKQPRGTADKPTRDIPMDMKVLKKTREQLKSEFGFEVKD
jgi:cyclophilin family peptidyl-prolyl cis-trans isomerase